jgi:hypothetical protein
MNRLTAVLLSTALFSTTAMAQDRACMMEGTLKVFGQSIYSKDCMQSGPKDTFQQLKQACEGLTQMAKMMGGTPPKITYLKQCPKPAQGICANYLGTGRDAYYYARSAQEIADFPKTCPTAGGRWLSGQ